MTDQLLQGRYRLIKDLKRGAFGKIYVAEDLQDSAETRACVVKQLQPNLTAPALVQEAHRRWENEIKALEKLGDHPRIPRLLDAFECDRKFYVVEEYIEGQDLSQLLGKGNRWSESWVVALLYQVLEVLAFIHQHQIIHRNIKPSNLIRRAADGKFALIDFGSLKEIETLAIHPQGKIGTAAIGTPGYIPIEQLGGKPGYNSDIYALGMTAIEALTGVSPRQLERDAKTGQLIWHHLRAVNPQLAQILDKMVCSDYQERYQQALDAINDLRKTYEIGKILDGRYKIVSLLGQSRLGKTFLAEDMQRPESPWCAIAQIKPLDANTFPWWEAKSFFDAEAQLLHRLGNHDRIPSLLADFEQDGAFYLVSEYIDGEPLSKEVGNGKKYDEATTIAFLQDVLETLKFIHEHHAIHSNLKPSNLIRRKSDGKIAIADFGSVKQIATLTIDQGQLTTTTAIGTPGYMPKEQMVGNPRPNSDIYALGAMALQLLTGVRPEFLPTDPHTGELNWRKHVAVSEGFSKILDKMVRSYFRERYESVSEVLGDLAGLQHSATVSEKPAAIAPPAIPSEPSPPVSPNRSLNDSPNQSSDRKQPLDVAIADKKAVGSTPLPAAWARGLKIPDNLKFVKPWPIVAVAAIAGTGAAIAGLNNYQQNRQEVQQADAYIESAGEKVKSQDLTAALDECDRAIGFRAGYAMAWKCRGDVLYLLERYESALVAYNNASKFDSENARYWNNQGETLYQLQRYKEAVAAHDRALELRQQDINALKGRGLALLSLERYEEALRDFDKAGELDREDPQIWERKALVLEYLQRPIEAERAFELALAAYDRKLNLNPDDVSGWIERGQVLSKLKRPEEAIASFDKALEIQPESYLAWNAKGTVLYKAGQLYDALDAYDRALALAPEFYRGWHNRGLLLSVGLGRHGEAIASYNRALEIEPTFYPALRDRGLAQLQWRDYPAALESFEEALKVAPNDAKSWSSHGVALNELRRYEEAIESFDKALAIQPNDPFTWTQRGIALESRELYQEALESYDKALEIQPNFPLAIESRLWVLGKLGR